MSGPPHVRLSRGGSWGVRRLQSPMHARGMFTDSARPFAGVLATKRAYLRSRCHSLGTRPWPVSVPLVLLGFACDFRRATESSPYWSSAAGFVRPACVSECRHPSGSWADSILHVQSIRDLKELVLFCFGGCSPATQTRCHGVAGSASVVSKKNSQYRRKLLESLRNFFSFFFVDPFFSVSPFSQQKETVRPRTCTHAIPVPKYFYFFACPPLSGVPGMVTLEVWNSPSHFRTSQRTPPVNGRGVRARVASSRGSRPLRFAWWAPPVWWWFQSTRPRLPWPPLRPSPPWSRSPLAPSPPWSRPFAQSPRAWFAYRVPHAPAWRPSPVARPVWWPGCLAVGGVPCDAPRHTRPPMRGIFREKRPPPWVLAEPRPRAPDSTRTHTRPPHNQRFLRAGGRSPP